MNGNFEDPFADDPMTPGERAELNKGMRDQDDEYNFDEVAEEVAKKRGLRVVYPQDNQLQIDLDTEAAWNNFKLRCEEFDIPKKWCEVNPSASGLPHRHVYITVPDRSFTEGERIAFQSALGSDPVRERLNAMRMFFGIKNPSRLFEK